jgi:hypothetical protein
MKSCRSEAGPYRQVKPSCEGGMSACVRSAERARIGLSQCIVFVSDETRFAASAFQPLTFHSQSKEIFDGRANYSSIHSTSARLPLLAALLSSESVNIIGQLGRKFFGRLRRCSGALLRHMAEPDTPERPRRYRWPIFVIIGLVLAILLAALWMSFEVRRTERIRRLNSSSDLPPRQP